MTTAAHIKSLEFSKARIGIVAEFRARQSTVKLLEAVFAIREAIIAKSWPELLDVASRCLGLGYVAFRGLEKQGLNLSEIEKFDHTLSEAYQRAFQLIAAGETSKEFLLTMREKLKKSDRIDLDASLEKLAKGKTTGVSLLEPYAPAIDSCLQKNLALMEELVILCLSRGLLATVHAHFNQALQALSARQEFELSKGSLSAIENAIDEFEGMLRNGQRSIYAAILKKEPATKLAQIAVSSAGDIERFIVGFAHDQALMWQAASFALKKRKGALAEKLGHLAAQAFAVTREAIASHAASYRFAASILSPRSKEDVSELLSKCDALPFSTNIPKGKRVELKKLDASLKDEFIEIEGFVTKVDVRREGDGKLLSQISILDPSSRALANAVAIFAHLPHAGVVKGSFVTLSGIFKTKSALFGGDSGVLIDTLALKQLSQQSWQIAFLELSNRWFQPWRNGANISWSLAPHHKIDDEFLLGAGELLFPPLIRQ